MTFSIKMSKILFTSTEYMSHNFNFEVTKCGLVDSAPTYHFKLVGNIFNLALIQ